MSPVEDIEAALGRRFPRVSGDEPVWLTMRDCTPWFSPREWG